MYVETERMLVRDFVTEDAADLYEILGDARVMEYCEPAYDLAKTEKFLADFCICRKGAVAAGEKNTGKVIGYILFREDAADVYEMGWFFNRSYWRQSYAFEACRAVIDYAFGAKKIHKIFAETIDAGKSVRLMEKLGMQPEGIQRSQVKDLSGRWADLYYYGLLEEDWSNRHVRGECFRE